MEKGSKVAIVCCSNGQAQTNRIKIKMLENTLLGIGLVPVFSDFIYEKKGVFGGSGQERAESLMSFYQDDEIKAVFDISGGDIANELLPYLDFDIIANSQKVFWGYSDLTTIINAVYAKTGVKSVLYQIRNIIGHDAPRQISDFSNTIFRGMNDLFHFFYEFVQKESMQGIVVGGNIRCLLKLAGTPYWPDMRGKVLLLEAFRGKTAQMVTYLSQLQQIDVFGQVSGILLGTFTEMEKEGCAPATPDLVKQYAGTELPIVKTSEIGHGSDSKGIMIGKEIFLQKQI